jgi:hypothetical protein
VAKRDEGFEIRVRNMFWRKKLGETASESFVKKA